MTQKGSNWQEARNIREMQRTYEAAEWLLRKKLDGVAYLVHKLRQESIVLSVNSEFCKQYLEEKVLILLEEEVQEHARRSRTKQKEYTSI